MPVFDRLLVLLPLSHRNEMDIREFSLMSSFCLGVHYLNLGTCFSFFLSFVFLFLVDVLHAFSFNACHDHIAFGFV